MLDMGIVLGSKDMAQELIVGVDTVYVHTDIKEVTQLDDFGDTFTLYQYHEIQYTKDEYIELMAHTNKELNSLINTMLGVSE